MKESYYYDDSTEVAYTEIRCPKGRLIERRVTAMNGFPVVDRHEAFSEGGYKTKKIHIPWNNTLRRTTT